MRLRVGVLTAALAIASTAGAQDSKDTCADASERAQKLVDQRRMLEARTAFLSCAEESCPGPIRHDCQAQLDELKKNIPSIVVRVKAKDGSDIAQGSLVLDGAKIGVLDGQLIEADPGTHKIHVDLPDGRAFDQQVILTPGDHARAVTFDPNRAVMGPTTIVEAPKEHWSTVRTVGFGGIWVGAAGIVTSVILFIVAQADQGSAVTEQDKSNVGKPGGCPSLDGSAYPPSGVPSDATCASAVSFRTQRSKYRTCRSSWVRSRSR